MRKRSFLAIVMSILMIVTMMPGLAFADDTAAAPAPAFVDMPNDWSTAALQSAVDNGLLKGYEGTDGTMIKPAGTLTRAEMATVVNRAFGATAQASLSGVNDVPATAWYAPEMAKAVQMGTMKSDAQMRPNACITRQEACTILARAFKLEASDTSALNAFSDSASVASFAKESMSALVAAGYVSGSNGNLNPLANITRAEFAKIMDNMVKQYVTAAGTATTVPATGNVMINVPDVTLEGVTINGSLIIGDGVGNGDITLNNVKVTGDTIVRGGGVNSFIIKGDSSLGKIVVAKVDGNVRVSVEGAANVSVVYIADGKDDVLVEGKVSTLEVAAADVPVVVQNAQITTVNVTAADADLTVAKTATVATVNVQKEAAGAAVAVAGTVTTLKTEAKAELAVTGTVTKVDVADTATGTDVKIDKAAKVETLNTAADVTTSGEGKATKTEGTGTVAPKTGGTQEPATTPVTGGGGGGGGSHSTPTVETVVVRPAGPASDVDGSFDYAGAYSAAGINVTNGTNKNSNTVIISVPATLTNGAVNTALINKSVGFDMAFVGIQFNKPSGATEAAVTIGSNDPETVVLTTESQDVYNGQYIHYFGVADDTSAYVNKEWEVNIAWKNSTGTISTSRYTVKRVVTGAVATVDNNHAFASLDVALAANGTSYKIVEDVTATGNITIAEDDTLTIAEGKTLTVPEGISLRLEGTLAVDGTLNVKSDDFNVRETGEIIRLGQINDTEIQSGSELEVPFVNDVDVWAAKYGDDNYITIHIEGEDLEFIEDEAHSSAWWVGVGIEKPDGADWDQVMYSIQPSVFANATETPENYKENDNYLVFYTDAGVDNSDDHITIDWDGEGTHYEPQQYLITFDLTYIPLISWKYDENHKPTFTTIAGVENGNPPYQLMQIDYSRNYDVDSTMLEIIMTTPAAAGIEAGTVLWREAGGTTERQEAYWQWSYRNASSKLENTPDDENYMLETGENLADIERDNTYLLSVGDEVTFKITAIFGPDDDRHTSVIWTTYTITEDDVAKATYEPSAAGGGGEDE